MSGDRPVDEGTPDLALIAATDAMLDRLAARRPDPADLDDPAAAVLALLAAEVEHAWVGPERLRAEYFGPQDVLVLPTSGAPSDRTDDARPPRPAAPGWYPDDAVVAHDVTTSAPTPPTVPVEPQPTSLWDSVDWGGLDRPAEPDPAAPLDGGAPWQYEDGAPPPIPAARNGFATVPVREPRRVRVRLIAVAAVAAAALWGVSGVVTGAWNPFHAGTIIAGQDDGTKAVDLLEDGLNLVSSNTVAAQRKLEEGHQLARSADLTDTQRKEINRLLVRLSRALQQQGVDLPKGLTPDTVTISKPDGSVPGPSRPVGDPDGATTQAPSAGADGTDTPDVAATVGKQTTGTSTDGAAPSTSTTSGSPSSTTTTSTITTTTTEPVTTTSTKENGKPTTKPVPKSTTKTKTPKGEASGLTDDE